MAPDVTRQECVRLARAMTLKNAAAGLPHGGGKSVIKADPRAPRERKEALVRAFAHALRHERDYIFGPDMGTDENAMAWVKDEIGRAVGLPAELGGIPLDELGATGWGLCHAVEVALAELRLPFEGARIVVQGYGAVGHHAARFMVAKGARLIAASDSRGAVRNDRGLDPAALAACKTDGKSVAEFAGGDAMAAADLIAVPCEVWLPAARPDVIDERNVERLATRIVAQGANIPATAAAEWHLHERGILSLPDFIANAGGVICAAMEYAGAGETAAFAAIAEKLRHNVAEMLARAAASGGTPREAAVAMARERVERAMAHRRWTIF
jgi:glutamate dehydrogenase (NAD(P)+)